MLKESTQRVVRYSLVLGIMSVIQWGCAKGPAISSNAKKPVPPVQDPQPEKSQPEKIKPEESKSEERKSEQRGPSAYEIQIPGKNRTEKCQIPQRFPQTSYSSFKDEIKLCSYNLYPSTSSHSKNKFLYNCPKVHNSSVAIELYKTPANISPTQFHKTVCSLSKGGKERLKAQSGYPDKEAKFKFNSSGVSIGSMLGYYHLANFFESVLVPAVVLRTVDIDTVLDHSLAGRYLARKLENRYLDLYYSRQVSVLVTAKHGVQAKLPSQYMAPEAGLGIVPSAFYSSEDNARLGQINMNSWAERQLTDDRTQVYGTLAENPGGEAGYSEASGVKSEKLRVDRFRNSSPFYLALKDARPISQILGSRDLKKAGQMMQGMQDVSAMLVLDFLFDQADRVGNIHYYRHYFFKDGKGQLRNISEKKFKKMRSKKSNEMTSEEIEILRSMEAGRVPIKVMLLKDNDGGFDLNMVKKYQLIANINREPAQYASWKSLTEPYLHSDLVVRHFSPGVYKGVMKLHRWILQDPQMKVKMAEYFINELRFTKGEYETFKNNLLSLYRILYTHCKAGRLHLDLDMKGYFSKGAAQVQPSSPGVCEGD